MKIGSLNNAVPDAAVTGERKATSTKTGSRASSSAGASATVDLSATASLLAQGGTDPTFDTAKVEKIAQAIRDGKFQVNHEAIADKLIANAQELLGRTSSGH